jgi:prepilin-type N-terminal cleavage/methylation domain-containing protein
MPSSRCPSRAARAFTLLEVAIVLLVVAILASGIALPLAAQANLRRHEEARHLLEEARDALLGFAAANGRLPCPATADSHGQEAFAAGADASSGACASFHGGFLPGAALGLAGLDAQGLVRDPWPADRNRIRYAVHGGTINAIANALTRANGMQMATLAGLADAPHYLYVCSTGAAANASGCGPAANQLTRRAAFVVLSTGVNGGLEPAPGSDESRNVDGDAVFVARESSADFDDVVDWGAITLLVNRMLVAGRLP